jgi:hypothetical protein
MRPKYRPTAYETAILTIYLVKLFDKEHGRKTSRFRLSERTLRTISMRSSLRGSFLDDWIDELGLLGWSAFALDDYFAFIERETVNSWARIGSARIANVLRRLHSGEPEVLDEIELQVAPEPVPDVPDGELIESA